MRAKIELGMPVLDMIEDQLSGIISGTSVDALITDRTDAGGFTIAELSGPVLEIELAARRYAAMTGANVIFDESYYVSSPDLDMTGYLKEHGHDWEPSPTDLGNGARLAFMQACSLGLVTWDEAGGTPDLRRERPEVQLTWIQVAEAGRLEGDTVAVLDGFAPDFQNGGIGPEYLAEVLGTIG
jgi:hypothetical protein